MKLICLDNGKKTTLRDLEEETLQSAVDRIIRREAPGHFGLLNQTGASYEARMGNTQRAYEEGWARGAVRHVEIVRGVGGMTEHTGHFVDFRIER